MAAVVPVQLKSIPRMLDGKYFLITKRENDKVTAVCTQCGKSRRGDIKSTGNFNDHYKNSHPLLAKEIEQYRKLKQDQNTPMKQPTIPSLMLSSQGVSVRRILIWFNCKSVCN